MYVYYTYGGVRTQTGTEMDEHNIYTKGQWNQTEIPTYLSLAFEYEYGGVRTQPGLKWEMDEHNMYLLN